jgi:hypothetical protein
MKTLKQYAFVMGVFCFFSLCFISCADEITDHEHQWGEWAVITAPDCYATGYGTRACPCGEADSNHIIPAEHDWGTWEIITAPLINVRGEEIRHCKRDGTHSETRLTALINSISKLKSTLASLPANTEATPHTLVVNLSNLGDFNPNMGTPGAISTVINSSGKYINLDLSPSTFYSLQGEFDYCTNLISITIPNSLNSFGWWPPFTGCIKLTAINIDTTNFINSSVDGIWYNKNKTSLIRYPTGKATSFTIPNSVTSIGYYAFHRCTNLTSVIIPDSVTSIGETAFAGCTSLATIDVGGNNTAYSSLDGVLYDKAQTTLIAYPAGKTDASFTIPNSVTYIGNDAFLFYGSGSLASVIIPNSVTYIGEWAFFYCSSLASVTFNGTIPSSGFSDFNSFDGDLRDKFYATDKTNGTPGTYTTTNPGYYAVWRKQP